MKKIEELKIEVIEISKNEIIAKSGEKRKLTDSLFGEGKDGANVG